MANLSLNVTKLTETVLSLNSQGQTQNLNTSPANNQTNGPIDRKELYSEFYEFEERKKRSKSVIVRGITAQDNSEFSSTFTSVCSYLLPDAPPLSGDLFCIDREKKIYRVNLSTKEAKIALLENAKKLEGHPSFGRIYIMNINGQVDQSYY